MVRVDNILTVDKSVIEAIDELITLFSTSDDFKNNKEIKDLNGHLNKLKDCFKDGTNIDFGKFGQLPINSYKYEDNRIKPVLIT